MAPDIRITAEPVDSQRCKFLVDRPVYQGVRRFVDSTEAAGSPLAEALFALPGVREVIVSGNLVTVVKQSPEAWQVAGKAVGAAIRQALGGGLRRSPIGLPRRGPRGSRMTSSTSGSTICSSSK